MRFPRVLAAAFLASTSALLFVACGDQDDHFRHEGAPEGDYCSSHTTCGSCTPVEGCGWCSYEDGSGSCATHSDRCRGSVYRWNWEPSACSSESDAGTDTKTTSSDADVASDAPPAVDAPSDTTPSSDAPATSDAIETSTDDASTTCTAPSRATVACVQTVGGTLCKSGEYTLSCHPDQSGTPIPDSTLGCKSVTLPGSASTFYCCPCAAP